MGFFYPTWSWNNYDAATATKDVAGLEAVALGGAGTVLTGTAAASATGVTTAAAVSSAATSATVPPVDSAQPTVPAPSASVPVATPSASVPTPSTRQLALRLPLVASPLLPLWHPSPPLLGPFQRQDRQAMEVVEVGTGVIHNLDDVLYSYSSHTYRGSVYASISVSLACVLVKHTHIGPCPP